MLRKPIYMGKIVVPEMGDEEKTIVDGVHEAIIDEDLFQKVQRVLGKVLERNASRVEKVGYHPELPLRGHLQCPKCGNIWTGSGSKGNGGVYYYYHCQNGCKERVRASEANLAFQSYLQTFRVYSEVKELSIMENIFKTKEGDIEPQDRMRQ